MSDISSNHSRVNNGNGVDGGRSRRRRRPQTDIALAVTGALANKHKTLAELARVTGVSIGYLSAAARLSPKARKAVARGRSLFS